LLQTHAGAFLGEQRPGNQLSVGALDRGVPSAIVRDTLISLFDRFLSRRSLIDRYVFSTCQVVWILWAGERRFPDEGIIGPLLNDVHRQRSLS